MLPLIQNPRARRLFLQRHALSEAPVGRASGQALHDLIERIGFTATVSVYCAFGTAATLAIALRWPRAHAAGGAAHGD